MANEQGAEGMLPDVIEQKYQELLALAKHPAKKRSLTRVRNALADLIKQNDTAFKNADVGQVCTARYGGPKAQSIANKTSLHLQELISCARENVKKSEGDNSASDVEKFIKEVMPSICNQQLRTKLRILLHELTSLRNQLNILKSNYHKDKTPLQFLVANTGGTGEQGDGPRLESLALDHVKAIRSFVNSLGNKIGGAGLYRNEYGALEDVDGNEVAGVGFIDALEKVLAIYDVV